MIKFFKLQRFLIKNYIFILSSFLQITIFSGLWIYYLKNPLFKCPCKKYQQGFPIAKSSAYLININIFIMLTSISISKIVKRFIYIPNHIITKIHLYIGFSLFFWSFIHIVAHYINFINNNINLMSGAGLTGNILFLCLVFIFISTKFQLNISYFYILHNISTIIFLIITIFHGSFCTIKYNIKTCPQQQSWIWILSGIILIIINLFYKYFLNTNKGYIIKISDNLYRLNLKLSEKSCGKIIWINNPFQNVFEWHPFTISLYNKYTSEVSIYIKSRGDWTTKFIENCTSYNIETKLNVKIDGPYYNLPKNFYFKLLNEPTLLITSGIGITTFSYYLQQIALTPHKIFKLYLIIILKNPNEISWLLPILQLLCKKDNFYILFYFTEINDNSILYNFPLNLKYINGRPNFTNILDDIYLTNLFNTQDSFINIFFSGNYKIYKELKQLTKNNKTFLLQNF